MIRMKSIHMKSICMKFIRMKFIRENSSLTNRIQVIMGMHSLRTRLINSHN